MNLTAKQADALRRDGYVQMPGLIPAEKVREARRAINMTLGLSLADKEAAGDPTRRLAGLAQAAPIVDLFHATRLKTLAQALLGNGKLDPKTRAAAHARFPQERGWPHRTPFHVDGVADENGVKNTSETLTLAAGVFLSDAPLPWMGNYALIPGSHAGPWRRRPVQLTGREGDVVLHHHRVAHSAFAFENRSPDVFYMAFFWARHVDHEALKPRAAAEPWIEWEGLRKTTPR